MFVDESWRGRGVGRALMAAVIAGARERGYATLRLGTLGDMNAAQALYESLGFRPIERYRPDELVDTLFYELALGRAPDRAPVSSAMSLAVLVVGHVGVRVILAVVARVTRIGVAEVARLLALGGAVGVTGKVAAAEILVARLA